MRRHIRSFAILAPLALAAAAGCSTNSKSADEPAAGGPASATQTPAARLTTAPSAAAPKKDVAFYEVDAGDRVYVFGKVASANAYLEGAAPANPVVKEKFSKTGKTVVFENVGPDTDGLVAAYAKANGIVVK